MEAHAQITTQPYGQLEKKSTSPEILDEGTGRSNKARPSHDGGYKEPIHSGLKRKRDVLEGDTCKEPGDENSIPERDLLVQSIEEDETPDDMAGRQLSTNGPPSPPSTPSVEYRSSQGSGYDNDSQSILYAEESRYMKRQRVRSCSPTPPPRIFKRITLDDIEAPESPSKTSTAFGLWTPRSTPVKVQTTYSRETPTPKGPQRIEPYTPSKFALAILEEYESKLSDDSDLTSECEGEDDIELIENPALYYSKLFGRGKGLEKNLSEASPDRALCDTQTLVRR